MIQVEIHSRAATFGVLAQPRASRSAVAGEHDGLLKVRLAAPPVDGAANEELMRLLAEFFGVPRREIEILGGASGRRKVIRINGLTLEAFSSALAGIGTGIDARPNRVVG
jgi:uncharacterized protein (TIGR00251 family)